MSSDFAHLYQHDRFFSPRVYRIWDGAKFDHSQNISWLHFQAVFYNIECDLDFDEYGYVFYHVYNFFGFVTDGTFLFRFCWLSSNFWMLGTCMTSFLQCTARAMVSFIQVWIERVGSVWHWQKCLLYKYFCGKKVVIITEPKSCLQFVYVYKEI